MKKKEPRPKPNLTPKQGQVTPLGFAYGAMIVERLHSDDAHGNWLCITTPFESVTVRSTRTGKLRVGKAVKHDGTLYKWASSRERE